MVTTSVLGKPSPCERLSFQQSHSLAVSRSHLEAATGLRVVRMHVLHDAPEGAETPLLLLRHEFAPRIYTHSYIRVRREPCRRSAPQVRIAGQLQGSLPRGCRTACCGAPSTVRIPSARGSPPGAPIHSQSTQTRRLAGPALLALHFTWVCVRWDSNAVILRQLLSDMIALVSLGAPPLCSGLTSSATRREISADGDCRQWVGARRHGW